MDKNVLYSTLFPNQKQIMNLFKEHVQVREKLFEVILTKFAVVRESPVVCAHSNGGVNHPSMSSAQHVKPTTSQDGRPPS